MTSLALSLILASAALHALWNAVLKRESDQRQGSVGVLIGAAITAGVASAFSPAPAFPSWQAFGWSAVAGAGEVLYFTTLGLALRSMPFGKAYVLARGVALLTVWPVSILFLGEVLTLKIAAGTVLVCLGLAIMGAGERGPARTIGIVWTVICGMTSGICQFGYKLALQEGGEATAVFAVALGLAAPVKLAWSIQRKEASLRFFRDRWVPVFCAGILCALSFLLFLGALRISGAGAVLTVRNTSIVFALLLGVWMGERPPKLLWLASAAVMAGAMVMSW